MDRVGRGRLRFAFLALAGAPPLASHAQDAAPKTARAVRIAGPAPRIDGALDDPAWSQLARLADGGAWIKLSGWYRLDSAAPYSGLHAAIARAAGLFGERMVWGSDWPHTGQPTSPPLHYEDSWAPVASALGASQAQRVREQGPLALYG